MEKPTKALPRKLSEKSENSINKITNLCLMSFSFHSKKSSPFHIFSKKFHERFSRGFSKALFLRKSKSQRLKFWLKGLTWRRFNWICGFLINFHHKWDFDVELISIVQRKAPWNQIKVSIMRKKISFQNIHKSLGGFVCYLWPLNFLLKDPFFHCKIPWFPNNPTNQKPEKKILLFA